MEGPKTSSSRGPSRFKKVNYMSTLSFDRHPAVRRFWFETLAHWMLRCVDKAGLGVGDHFFLGEKQGEIMVKIEGFEGRNVGKLGVFWWNMSNISVLFGENVGKASVLDTSIMYMFVAKV